MRRCVHAVLALVTMAALAACGSSSAARTDPPRPSAVGKPAGAPVTKTVGAAGGSVASADGLLSVTVPAGALAADIAIGVQPIENTAAGGVGAAYRLTPAGQKFAQPVTISFPYEEEGLAGIAFQDDGGRWEWREAAVDATAKRMSVTTTHFSDWSKVPGIQLRPAKASIRPNARLDLTVNLCLQLSDGDVTYLAYACGVPVGSLAARAQIDPKTWAVNGAPQGTTGLGLVSGGRSSATYTAPARRPPGGTVAVSVQVLVKGKKTVIISSRVTIIGGYRAVGRFSEKNSPLACAGTTTALISDTVELSLTPDDKDSFKVTDIKNTKTVYAKPLVPGGYVNAVVADPPEIFTATKGTVEIGGTPDLVVVAVDGITVLGKCVFGGPIVGTGQTSFDKTGFAFHTANFVKGTQKVPQDIGYRAWTWIITEI